MSERKKEVVSVFGIVSSILAEYWFFGAVTVWYYDQTVRSVVEATALCLAFPLLSFLLCKAVGKFSLSPIAFRKKLLLHDLFPIILIGGLSILNCKGNPLILWPNVLIALVIVSLHLLQ